jgi:hypothetical protein
VISKRKILQALAGIFASEAYKTSPANFINTTELKRAVVEFEASFLKVCPLHQILSIS